MPQLGHPQRTRPVRKLKQTSHFRPRVTCFLHARSLMHGLAHGFCLVLLLLFRAARVGQCQTVGKCPKQLNIVITSQSNCAKHFPCKPRQDWKQQHSNAFIPPVTFDLRVPFIFSPMLRTILGRLVSGARFVGAQIVSDSWN